MNLSKQQIDASNAFAEACREAAKKLEECPDFEWLSPRDYVKSMLLGWAKDYTIKTK